MTQFWERTVVPLAQLSINAGSQLFWHIWAPAWFSSTTLTQLLEMWWIFSWQTGIHHEFPSHGSAQCSISPPICVFHAAPTGPPIRLRLTHAVFDLYPLGSPRQDVFSMSPKHMWRLSLPLHHVMSEDGYSAGFQQPSAPLDGASLDAHTESSDRQSPPYRAIRKG